MAIPLELVALRVRLQDAGIVVVEEPDHLTLRLPFFCSVHVRLIDGRLKLDAYSSTLPRMKATLLRFVVLALLSTGAIKLAAPFSVGLTALVVLVAIADVFRWIVSEQAITKTQIIWSMMPRSSEDSATRELAAGAGIAYGERQRAADTVPRS